jgi:hypothetical protein
MQSLARRSKSDLMFSSAIAGLAVRSTSVSSASHLSDVIQGTDWVGTYGGAGYILPATPTGQTILNSSLRSIPSWVEELSASGLNSFADTTCVNQPEKPDESGANLFLTSASFSTSAFSISLINGPKKIAFYITTDPTAPTNGLGLGITIRNGLNTLQALVSERIYDNTTAGTLGISTVGGLVVQYQVSGSISVSLRGLGTFNAGLLHGIFFDN